MEKKKAQLVTVLGHTAGGKTAFAARLASEIGGEIISADSRQVYRGMDLGTGKDYDDYLVGDARMPVHLIDIVEAGYEYNLFQFRSDFHRVFTDITERGRVPLLCGGTGLYIESVLRNYRMIHVPIDRELREDLGRKSLQELEEILRLYGPLHNVTDTANRKRLIRAIEIAMHQRNIPEQEAVLPDLKYLVFGIRFEREFRRKRITERLRERLSRGMVEEVEGLLKQGVTPVKMDYYGLEYRCVTQYLRGELDYEEMFSRLNTAIHRFAKRQMTYFRGMERRGVKIHWINGSLDQEEKIAMALEIYRNFESVHT